MEDEKNGSVNSDILEKRMVEVSVFEFIEETKYTAIDGESTFWCTRKDGSFVSDSLSHDKTKALAFFDNVVKNNGLQIVQKILKTSTVKSPVSLKRN